MAAYQYGVLVKIRVCCPCVTLPVRQSAYLGVFRIPEAGTFFRVCNNQFLSVQMRAPLAWSKLALKTASLLLCGLELA